MSEPHEPAAECRDAHCYVHNVDEAVGVSTYRVCVECGHAYQTAEDLVRAYMVLGFLGERVPDPAEIFACPLCAHDF